MSGHRPPPTRPRRSLKELMVQKAALLVVCRRCKHRRLLYPARLSEQLGPDFQVIDLRQRLRCSQCRALAANIHETTR